MAYLRKEHETVEIDYSLEKVWKKIPKALEELEWAIEEVDEKAHRVKTKTPQGYILWSSTLSIDLVMVNDKTTRVSVVAETPFTTISAIVDLGRARKRIDIFFATLANQLTPNHDVKSSGK
jgi:hypothetical protein